MGNQESRKALAGGGSEPTLSSRFFMNIFSSHLGELLIVNLSWVFPKFLLEHTIDPLPPDHGNLSRIHLNSDFSLWLEVSA